MTDRLAEIEGRVAAYGASNSPDEREDTKFALQALDDTPWLCSELRTAQADNARLREALKAAEKGFLADAQQKTIIGDDVIYHLDGQTVGWALERVRAALKE